MIMQRRGFSLIEVMIALMITSMLLAGLFATIYQVGFMQRSVETIVSADERAAIILHQMERDIMGVFIPEQIHKIIKKEDEDSKKGIDKVFYGTQKEKQLELLTFITNNPLELYLKIKNVKPKPRVARVLYRLVPEKGHKNSFTLTRQEGQKLSFKEYKKDAKGSLRPFNILEGLASCSITYFKLEGAKKGEESKKNNYKKLNHWPEKETADKKKTITLPAYVELKIELWDNAYENKKSFSMQIPILIDPRMPKPIKKPKPKTQQAPQAQPAKTPSVTTAMKKKTQKPNKFSLTSSLMEPS